MSFNTSKNLFSNEKTYADTKNSELTSVLNKHIQKNKFR